MRVTEAIETSPFYLCDVDKKRHDGPKVWPTMAAPTGMFRDVHATGPGRWDRDTRGSTS